MFPFFIDVGCESMVAMFSVSERYAFITTQIEVNMDLWRGEDFKLQQNNYHSDQSGFISYWVVISSFQLYCAGSGLGRVSLHPHSGVWAVFKFSHLDCNGSFISHFFSFLCHSRPIFECPTNFKKVNICCYLKKASTFCCTALSKLAFTVSIAIWLLTVPSTVW